MKTIEPYVDPMDELYSIRKEISARYGHDVHLLAEAARAWKREDEASGMRYVSLPIVRRKPVVEFEASGISVGRSGGPILAS